MKQFMEPRSVALVGISSKVGKGSFNLLQSLLQIGFPGNIYPVNPHSQRLLGHDVFPDILAVPEPVDLAVIMTPRQVVPRVLEQCATRGIHSVLIVSQGFSEADQEGGALQSTIDRIIKETGVRVLGPNSIGIVNHFARFSTYFVPMTKEDSPIAFITQSGGFLEGFSGFKIGKGIDLGNSCDIGFEEALAYFGEDPQIRVIGLYVEGIKNGRTFLDVARKVARKKLLLVLKAGKSEQGAKAVLSHTGSLAGEEAVYEAAFKQAGFIRVRNIEEFGDISQAYLNLPPLRGNRIGVITPTGAGGILVLDAARESGFLLNHFSKRQMEGMKEFFLPWHKLTNPLDIMSAALAHGYKNIYTKALETLGSDINVDAIVCVLGEPTLKTVMEAKKRFPTKPIVSWVFGQPADLTRRITSTGTYPSPERALRSLAALREHQVFLKKPSRGKPLYSADRKSVQEILQKAKAHGQKILTREAFPILAAYGIPAAAFRIAKTQGQALRVARELKYPVVLKVCSRQILHKSDVGAVSPGIRDPKELRYHYGNIISAVHERVPDAKIEGVIVQKMIIEGKELILGAKRDPQFGPVVLFGWGGVFTEVLKDFSCGICPLSSEDAESMISSTKMSTLLAGCRGDKPSDRFFLKECILRLSQLVSEFPEIGELDINPIKVFAKGGAAVDVRAVID